MRLIHTATLKLHEFFSDIPDYAILSHCWGNDEVSLQDFRSGSKKDSAGYKKIVNCCHLARRVDLKWAWVDSCCIDKSSSAELSEAINSMFRWYKRAYACFAFLSDITSGNCSSSLADCRWFTRGFTLQELLAPPQVIFVDSNMDILGSRRSLAIEIADITGIPERYLSEWRTFKEASVAQRMSWASKRHTSRPEDIAYCLLGLFGVNMPLLYGEGEKQAFLRLQHQIVARNPDETVFAWMSDDPFNRRGMFARSPGEFARCQYVYRSSYKAKRPAYAPTNKGLEFPVAARITPGWAWTLLHNFLSPGENAVRIQLECEYRDPSMPVQSVSIRLVPVAEGDGVWCRTHTTNLTLQRQSRFLQLLRAWCYDYVRIYVTEPEPMRNDNDAARIIDADERSGWINDELFPNLCAPIPPMLWLVAIFCLLGRLFPHAVKMSLSRYWPGFCFLLDGN